MTTEPVLPSRPRGKATIPHELRPGIFIRDTLQTEGPVSCAEVFRVYLSEWREKMGKRAPGWKPRYNNFRRIWDAAKAAGALVQVRRERRPAMRSGVPTGLGEVEIVICDLGTPQDETFWLDVKGAQYGRTGTPTS